MPYVLKRKDDGKVLTGMLVNVYDLQYYGTVFWNEKEEAQEGFRRALMEAGEEDDSAWDVAEMAENTLKLCNVKLNNDPSRDLYWERDGRVRVIRRNP